MSSYIEACLGAEARTQRSINYLDAFALAYVRASALFMLSTAEVSALLLPSAPLFSALYKCW